MRPNAPDTLRVAATWRPVAVDGPPPAHVAEETAKAEATLAALHVAVGGLECHRFEVPDYDDEHGAFFLAGYCFEGDGYLVGWYNRAILVS